MYCKKYKKNKTKKNLMMTEKGFMTVGNSDGTNKKKNKNLKSQHM